MKVRCNNLQVLEFLRLLSEQDAGKLRNNACWQQIGMIAPAFGEGVLLTEVQALFETYLDYILKSSDRDMIEVESELDRLEAALNLKGKLPWVYRPIVEKMMANRGEVERILQALRQFREARGKRQRRSRKTKRGSECCKAAAHI